jgi:outer membrane lipoprotein-sorting protein
MKHLSCLFTLWIVLACLPPVHAQTAEELVQKVKEKFDKINDYTAKGKMKMNVTFIKAPVATINVYYKKPDKIRINNEKGISLIPKGSFNINIGTILAEANEYDIIDGGKEDKTGLRIVKMLPTDEAADIVLSTFYIDENQFLVKKARTTTRENGTYELEMSYGKYAEFGLADKIVFSFNTKDYKLPKGVTFDYDDGSKENNAAEKQKNRKGKVEIVYSEYQLNKGIPDAVFN